MVRGDGVATDATVRRTRIQDTVGFGHLNMYKIEGEHLISCYLNFLLKIIKHAFVSVSVRPRRYTHARIQANEHP